MKDISLYAATSHMRKTLELLHSTCLADNKKADRNKTIEFVEENSMDKFDDSFAANLFSPSFKDDLADEIVFAAKIE